MRKLSIVVLWFCTINCTQKVQPPKIAAKQQPHLSTPKLTPPPKQQVPSPNLRPAYTTKDGTTLYVNPEFDNMKYPVVPFDGPKTIKLQ